MDGYDQDEPQVFGVDLSDVEAMVVFLRDGQRKVVGVGVDGSALVGMLRGLADRMEADLRRGASWLN